MRVQEGRQDAGCSDYNIMRCGVKPCAGNSQFERSARECRSQLSWRADALHLSA